MFGSAEKILFIANKMFIKKCKSVTCAFFEAAKAKRGELKDIFNLFLFKCININIINKAHG